MSSGEIWHDVCINCHPERELAICGTKIESDHREVEDDTDLDELLDGQNCVVCMSMECPECFEEAPGDIVGTV